jgi:hypothetical protein
MQKIETSKMSASQLYKTLTKDQRAYLDRARAASLLTLPQLYPPEGANADSTYPTPYQSLGAKGVNNLANKVVLSLFPPSTAFFKMGLSPADMAALGKGEGELQQAMYILESSVVNEMEVSALRPKLVHLIKLLIVGGSAVVFVPEAGAPEIFDVSTFGVRRDKKGNVLRLALKQAVAYTALDPQVANQIPKNQLSEDVLEGKKLLDMYTAVVKVAPDTYEVFQEIMDVRIRGTEGTYKKDLLPYLFIPFVDTGEDYGRSYVEDFIGDLESYEGLRQAILEASAESARILYLLSPNATLSLKKLQSAKSGDVLLGNQGDVSVLQSDKRLDMSVTQREAENLKQDIAITFLLDSAVRRDAERVTAAEIRQVSQELEVALGGIYSTLASTVQKPLVRLYLERLVKQGKVSELLSDSLELEITTGAAALGRGTDFNVLSTFVQTLSAIAQQPTVGEYINMSELIKRLAYSLDINTASLVISDEQRAQMQAEQQQAAMEQQIAPEVARSQLQQE